MNMRVYFFLQLLQIIYFSLTIFLYVKAILILTHPFKNLAFLI